MNQLLEKLINCFSVSGYEDDMRKLIKSEINDVDVEIKEDNVGNIIVKVGEAKEKIMICSHMDNFGVMIRNIQDDGFARISKVGDFEINNLPNNFIRFKNGSVGKVVAEKKDPGEKDVYIDLAAKNKDDALDLIKEGDVANCIVKIFEKDDYIISSNLNNAIGCYTLIRIINEVSNFKRQTYFVFSSRKHMENVAKVAAYNINPDYCIMLGNEQSCDIPGNKGNIKIGNGPVIIAMDKSLIIHQDIKNIIEKTSKESKINIQYSVSKEFTDAGGIHKELGGIKTGVFSVPMRYIYTPSEMVSLSDVEDRINILKALI